MSRVIAANQDDTTTGTLPPTITDAQGRVFRLQQDPVTGAPQYRHASQQRDQAGNTLDLEIVITLAADGSYSRRTAQNLQLTSGEAQRAITLQSFDPQGLQVGQVDDTETRKGTSLTTEHVVGTFTAGALVHRAADVVQQDAQTDAKTKESVHVESRIHADWDNGGTPITSATVPVLDRQDTQRYGTPGGGINKDTDRILTFTRHAAGPVNALDWDDAGKLVVRFEGHKGQYLERELRVPLAQDTGAPDMTHAEEVRTDDHQNLVNRGLMKARIWGGLASNLSWIIGLNFTTGRARAGLLAVSAAASGAELVGEVHAVATKRNDGDWGRVAMSAYDALLTGALAAFISHRKPFTGQQITPGITSVGTALAATGLAVNGAELAGSNPIGIDALDTGIDQVRVGALGAAGAGTLRTGLDTEPRFDAAAALLGGR